MSKVRHRVCIRLSDREREINIYSEGEKEGVRIIVVANCEMVVVVWGSGAHTLEEERVKDSGELGAGQYFAGAPLTRRARSPGRAGARTGGRPEPGAHGGGGHPGGADVESGA